MAALGCATPAERHDQTNIVSLGRLKSLKLGHWGGTSPAMIRPELAARIAAQNPHLYAKEVDALISAILDRIATALASGDRVEIRNFGTFEVRQRNARIAHNPKTGERVVVAARATIGFRTGKTMHGRLNGIGDGSGRRADRPLQARH